MIASCSRSLICAFIEVQDVSLFLWNRPFFLNLLLEAKSLIRPLETLEQVEKSLSCRNILCGAYILSKLIFKSSPIGKPICVDCNLHDGVLHTKGLLAMFFSKLVDVFTFDRTTPSSSNSSDKSSS
ncbi:unnamed protein product [Moneuplotes crassus]|uniref:Uncharacterized protein n=1 Tax=Euplotes crassus TaxID=5936 RepID=A0AAD1UH34_EUPCR|nr:unnamed protein product [Moneuplotes crassus]